VTWGNMLWRSLLDACIVVRTVRLHPPDPAYNGRSAARIVSPDAEVQVHPAALPLDLVDLALAVLLAARLERE